MAYIKLLKDVKYKGRTFGAEEIIEVGEELGGRMILAGQAVASSHKEFEEYRNKNDQEIEHLTKKELEQICKELGIEEYAKKKKAELIELIKAARGE